MQFVIFTHVPHIKQANLYYAYAPYVREMNIWIQNVDDLVIVAPLSSDKKTEIDGFYINQNTRFREVSNFDILSLKSIVATIVKLPKMIWVIYNAMQTADHIHLRCPGNIGLIACFVQILFPNKPKTAKYAGNWDPNAHQPWTYKLQQKLLSNTFFTRNMQVLVYGEWAGMTKNIKPFFTATYNEEDKKIVTPKVLKGKIDFVFVGALVKGKNPFYAIQLVKSLSEKGCNVSLRLYGEGVLRKELEEYIIENVLDSMITLEGNQSKGTVQKAYQESHFVLLPSESEGWPKAIAEGMFWGCVPIATSVSCVPLMLDNGNRGVLLEMNLKKDTNQLLFLIANQMDYDLKHINAVKWSSIYTLDFFKNEIEKLLLLNAK
ncbi:glycosyltransferase family 4 protein [Flavobacterium sp. K5-23]|uniref:glycosyltransferase family 4 protein n=1 Tax=Flavobacterium sp. K5-23 TaxID=2746225 RepID=UPI00200CE799|nr:glycosyltransferase [Flavobacterium sp. K5-23]UQD56169.1 glycosyltransferase [Flavobacterium sp. K5-23]